MADDINQAFKEITKEFNELRSALSGEQIAKLAPQLAAVGAALRSSTRDAATASNAMAALKLRLGDIGGTTTLLKSKFKKMGDVISASSGNIEGAFAAIATEIGGVALVARGLIDVPANFKKIGDSAASASMQMSDFSSKMKSISGILPEKMRGAFEKAGRVLDIGGAARNFENAMLQAVAAGGNMGDMIGVIGNDMAGLDSQMSQWVIQQQKIADVTGMSTGQVLGLSRELAKIPGALGEGVVVGRQSTQTYDELEAIIRASHGSFQDIGEVMNDVAFSINTLGSSTQSALEMTTRMAAVGNSLNMPLDVMRNFTHKAAEAFKFLGDNTQGAISVMSKMGPALRESGLGPAAVQEIVSGFIRGAADMDIAQKAFVAAQTGGAGGMQGAFEIDLALREGNLDEVAGKVQQTLEGMIGGPLVTLKEAASSQTAASQMTKQIQFLTTGPLKVAQNEQQAIALVEAMARQQRGEMGGEGAPSPAEALENAMKRGETREDRQIDALQMLNNEAEAHTILLSQIVDQRRREFGGPEGGGVIAGEIKRQQEIQTTGLRLTQQAGGVVAAGATTDTRGQMEAGRDRILDIVRQARETSQQMRESMGRESSTVVPTVAQLEEQTNERRQRRGDDLRSVLTPEAQQRMDRQGMPPRPGEEVVGAMPAPTTPTGAGRRREGQAPENERTIIIKVLNDKNEVIEIVNGVLDEKTGAIIKTSVEKGQKKQNDALYGG